MAQVPGWSGDDLDFFLHGSMSTEFVPETVLRSFMRAYPELFPAADLSHLGTSEGDRVQNFSYDWRNRQTETSASDGTVTIYTERTCGRGTAGRSSRKTAAPDSRSAPRS